MEEVKKRNHVTISRTGNFIELKILASSEEMAEKIFRLIAEFGQKIKDADAE